AITQLGKASDFAKPRFQSQVLELSGRVLAQQNDVSALYERIPQLHEAGIFAGTDWASPQNLIAQL
ncbi:hypothetical protein GWO43_05340, partial [candidate division KSB1 bacterium]|nr:hypothetical protein [candidate division KSB1 bacterium]NIS23424.1 hypothetical protein [candidate division KSB1 bacterium]NIT70318.1 hypothetical protein [candidate division KSB1 bacterium]NIU24042.1 hypothetical protein [candidate division KSB1 bacterium]NIU92704.1 hypothetical protein [candidate division KSB1 bacterium]